MPKERIVSRLGVSLVSGSPASDVLRPLAVQYSLKAYEDLAFRLWGAHGVMGRLRKRLEMDRELGDGGIFDVATWSARFERAARASREAGPGMHVALGQSESAEVYGANAIEMR